MRALCRLHSESRGAPRLNLLSLLCDEVQIWGDFSMLRQLAVAALAVAAVFAMTDSSFASVKGRSYRVEASDGTNAGVFFDKNGTDMTVHVPGADIKGKYTEAGDAISVVNGSHVGLDYLGSFVGVQIEIKLGNIVLVPSQMQGFGIGTTGIYTFKALAKN